MFKLDLEKAEGPDIKLPIFVESQEKQENSRKISTSASLTMLKPLTVWITTNCGKFLNEVKVAQSCLTLFDPMEFMEFSRPEYWSGQPFPSPGDLPNSGIEPRSPTLQADSLPVESQGKPKNTRVDRPILLQGIFPTQESNWGLLHCRWILYQLSYQGKFLKRQEYQTTLLAS